jgi:hypothetical protein
MPSYKVVGPFKIPFELLPTGVKSISSAKSAKPFWVENAEIKVKKGCYLFGMQTGRGITPYYIGKATQNFGQEIFTPHTLVKYNKVAASYKRGIPVMFFVVQERASRSSKLIGEMEKFLIPLAYLRNPSLENDQHIGERKWSIHNIVGGNNQGKINNDERAFRNMMGIKKKIR